MRTITFYSYKGGVGRSLLVANAARYLAMLGKRVFAIDFDLEAPGLDYKFALTSARPASHHSRGLVDLLATYVARRALPTSLNETTVEVPSPGTSGGIRMMRAGMAPLGSYWRQLSAINWHELFYGADACGVAFFLELRKRIEVEYSPDFLLIDSRTGITEMGGVATTILPDVVVCLGLATAEHLDGLRAVMHGIRNASIQDGKQRIQMLPVISRISSTHDVGVEGAILAEALRFLNSPMGNESPSLALSEILALHSEPALDQAEQLLVASKASPHDFPLLRDYLRLFAMVIPVADVAAHVETLVSAATARLLDDPDGAQGDLEALTTYCAVPEAFRALLKLYRVRKAPQEKFISTAALAWQLGVSVSDPLLVEAVRTTYSDIGKSPYVEPKLAELQRKHVDFANAVWSASGAADGRTGLAIIAAYLPERRERALAVAQEHVSSAVAPDPALVASLVELTRLVASREAALVVVERYKSVGARIAKFHSEWAKLIVDSRDPDALKQLASDPLFDLNVLKATDPPLAFRVCRLLGTPSDVLLGEFLDRATSDGTMRKLREVAEMFQEEGKSSEFEAQLRTRLPRSAADEFLESLQRRPRHLRF